MGHAFLFMNNKCMRYCQHFGSDLLFDISVGCAGYRFGIIGCRFASLINPIDFRAIIRGVGYTVFESVVPVRFRV